MIAKSIEKLLDILGQTPLILENLLDTIPPERYSLRRLPGKWSIHEQVCHLVDAQQVLIDRFRLFEQQEDPLIRNYEPSPGIDKEPYMHMNMEESLRNFPGIREKMLKMLGSYSPDYWQKQGRHENFSPYGTKILLMHCLNVDYAHLFSIEQLGLTKPGMEEGIMVLP